MSSDRLRSLVRTIPDYPKPGVLFFDITTLLEDGPGFTAAIDALAAPYRGAGLDKVAGVEARGFIVGGAVAVALGAGFVTLRKRDKLPHVTVGRDYQLEYGLDRIEMHREAIAPGERVLVVDDLIATGGTAVAAVELLRDQGAAVEDACFLIDLPELGGSERLRTRGVRPFALLEFDEGMA